MDFDLDYDYPPEPPRPGGELSRIRDLEREVNKLIQFNSLLLEFVEARDRAVMIGMPDNSYWRDDKEIREFLGKSKTLPNMF